MNGRNALGLIGVALGIVGAGWGCGGDPRGTLDGCDLPTPCGRVFQSHTAETLEPLDQAACIHDVLASGKPAHFTVELSDVATGLWDLYVDGPGPAILITSECELHGSCTKYRVERCVLRPLAEIECIAGDDAKTRVCGEPPNWCASLVLTEPACP
jgi:hypothetical protein